MKSFPHRYQLAAAALAAAVSFTPATYAATTSPTGNRDLVAAREADSRGRNASDILGRDVHDRTGESLGQITDLLVDPTDGKILFAIVGSGGLLGVGEDLYPVPFEALRVSGDDRDEFALNLERSRWSSAPKIREEQFASLNSHPMGRSIFDFYGKETGGELKQLSSRARQMHLMRVADLPGKEVMNVGEEVGEIEDVIVHTGSQHASILLDPEDDYTGTDAKFIIRFDQLTPTADRDNLTTSLTRAEFERAAPAEENWWSTTTGYPYIWGAPYATASGAAFAVQPVPGENRTRDAGSDVNLEGRPSVTVVRGALRSDADLPESARRATIEQRGNTLVITGTVESQSIQQQVGDTVKNAAPGWTVENRLTVRSAAE